MGAPKEGCAIYKSNLRSASAFSEGSELNRESTRIVRLKSGARGVVALPCTGLGASEFGSAPAFTGTQDVVTLADFFTGAHEFVG